MEGLCEIKIRADFYFVSEIQKLGVSPAPLRGGEENWERARLRAT